MEACTAGCGHCCEVHGKSAGGDVGSAKVGGCGRSRPSRCGCGVYGCACRDGEDVGAAHAEVGDAVGASGDGKAVYPGVAGKGIVACAAGQGVGACVSYERDGGGLRGGVDVVGGGGAGCGVKAGSGAEHGLFDAGVAGKEGEGAGGGCGKAQFVGPGCAGIGEFARCVVAGVEDDVEVGAFAAVDGIVASAAGDGVVARTAGDLIFQCIADDCVVANAADRIFNVAGIGDADIVGHAVAGAERAGVQVNRAVSDPTAQIQSVDARGIKDRENRMRVNRKIV